MKKKTDKRAISRKFALSAVLLLTIAVTAIGGCGSSEKYSSENTAAAVAEDAVYESAMDGGIYEYEAAGGIDAESGEAKDVQDQSRKLIKNVDMSVETENFDLLISNVEQKVEELGGYVEQSNIYNGSYTSSYRSRSASITARIPAQKLDSFISDVSEQSNVTRKNESVEDITLQYVDLESHKKALQAEQESLLTMLENAESIEDIITINEQLTDVRYQLESMESQLRTYDNKIDYSTVYLDVQEVEQYEPYVAKSAGERISEGFVRNVHKVCDGISNFFIELIIALPFLVVIAVFVGIVIAIIYFATKAGEKRAAKRREKAAANPGQYNRYGMRINTPPVKQEANPAAQKKQVPPEKNEAQEAQDKEKE
ncbi:MAG: DUF4349 domain-containing protein [Eubacteriales bacterium]|nr:DUF4349 domain-containing protein [Eubacteriales bacterium]